MTVDSDLALVTGASTGIGRALAHQFVDHGYEVATHLPDRLTSAATAVQTRRKRD